MAQAISRGVVAGETDQPAIGIDSDNTTISYANSQAHGRGADAATQIEHRFTGFCRDCGRKKYWIDCSPIAARRLHQFDAAIEEEIFSDSFARCARWSWPLAHTDCSFTSRRSVTARS